MNAHAPTPGDLTRLADRDDCTMDGAMLQVPQFWTGRIRALPVTSNAAKWGNATREAGVRIG